MVQFTVIGDPAPQGSKKFVGNGVMVESSKKVKPWRDSVAWQGRSVMWGLLPCDGPLQVELHFTLRKPQSAPKKRQTWPDRKPDLDKLIRSTMDAIKAGGVITDDARAVSILAWKHFPNEHPHALNVPGCIVTVRSIDE